LIFIKQLIFRITNSSSLKSSDVIFRAGTAELRHPGTICFRNLHFQNYCEVEDSPAINEQHQVVDMHGKLYHVWAVKIGILSMYSGSVPSIRSLKIWAIPSKSCSKDTKERYLKRWYDYKEKDQLKGSSKHISNNGMTFERAESIKSTTQIPHQSLPKDFFDPLTLSMMKNPVLLPGGQTVDRTTLDKHIQSQAEWGRPPTDPFTGVIFTDAYQPVPNVMLKLKLDQYSMCETPSISGVNDEKHTKKSKKNSVENFNHMMHKSNCLANKDSPVTSTSTRTCKSADIIASNNTEVVQSISTRRILQIPHFSYNPLRCCKCRSLFSSLTTQYLLPCHHKLCRGCLLSSSLICSQCGKSFERKDVSRTFS